MNDELTDTLDESAVSELFHENTKQHRSDLRFVERIVAASVNPLLHRMMTTAHKSYSSALKNGLPKDFPKASMSFEDVILSRRSSRDFSGEPLSFSEVAKLLHFANGITGSIYTGDRVDQLFRASPSGGALYPVEIYLIALTVSGLASGLYHYNPLENNLEALSNKKAAQELKKITHIEEVSNAAAVIALSGISAKSRLKYGERGYRFMLLEAGHIAQNILLTAHSLLLAAFSIGGFIDDELDELLGIDGIDEVSLYLVAVGKSLIL
jgi:SagB-type dehydrogenase family enzyme